MVDSIITIAIASEPTEQRLDKFLADHPDLTFSRSQIQKLLEAGAVSVNSQPANKKQRLHRGDTIEIIPPEVEPLYLQPEDIPLDIVFEDDYLAVVNKPAGLITHPGAGNKQGTLVNALLHHIQSLGDSGESDRPGIVHRLDKETSGLLVIAKDDATLRSLQEMLQARTIKRSYLALICGHVTEDIGVIDLPVGRALRDRKKMAVTDKNSREAVTEYSLKKRYRTYDLLEISLKTGRTHQIRVHFSHLGHPVLGDPEYGGREKWHKGIFAPERPLGKKLLGLIKRQALHAARLEFIHPHTNKPLSFEAKLPDDFTKVLRVLDNEGY